MIATPIYNGIEFQTINFDIALSNTMLGDANFDQTINVLDVVILVNFAIGSSEPTDLEIEANWCPYCSESLDLARINSSLGIDYEYSESQSEG